MKKRMIIALEGTPIAVRVMLHKEDPMKLVLKAPNDFAAAEFCSRLGVPVLAAFKGSSYHITTVWRATFFERFAAAGMGLLTAPPEALPEPKAAAPQTIEIQGLSAWMKAPEAPVKAQAAAGKCTECGCSDGTHWGFCPFHAQN